MGMLEKKLLPKIISPINTKLGVLVSVTHFGFLQIPGLLLLLEIRICLIQTQSEAGGRDRWATVKLCFVFLFFLSVLYNVGGA